MLTDALSAMARGFALLVAVYFAVWNVALITMGAVAWLGVWRHRLTRTRRDVILARRFEATPLVSIIVPAFNEAVTIVESIRALLALDYEPSEIVVVNDGSSDGTLALLRDTFHLIAAPLAFDQPLTTEPVRGIYRSVQDPRLVVIDKQNGGSKSDALNAGVNVASGRYVLTIDADTVLEPDALSRAILPVFDDSTTVAVAGNIAIANGCRIEAGRITEVALPRSWTARLQIVEYMRSFLLFRVATAAHNGIVIVSGAFGLFRRDAVVAVGGYDRTAIGEDMDLTLRLQRHYRERREPFWIVFDPFPLCSTQAPEDLRSLRNQRYRWRRGLLQSLWRHRGMIGNPRMGAVGLGVLPVRRLCRRPGTADRNRRLRRHHRGCFHGYRVLDPLLAADLRDAVIWRGGDVTRPAPERPRDATLPERA